MTRIELTEQAMAELQGIMRKQTGNAGLARRAWCVLLCASGQRRVDMRRAPTRPVAKLEARALDRKDRQLPLSPGRAQSHGFEYKRNGTSSLFAALNTATGEVLGKTAQRHTTASSSCAFWKKSWPSMTNTSQFT